MKKYIMDFEVSGVKRWPGGHALLRLRGEGQLPEIVPGQFAEIKIDDSPSTFLRRPISICNVDYPSNEIWILVAPVGDGTKRIAALEEGSRMNCVLPLGNGFTIADDARRVLLVGGGVGVAPLYYLGSELRRRGAEPVFLLGARNKDLLLMQEEFAAVGQVFVTTEDGCEGEKGFVTDHSLWDALSFDTVQTCGPKPMMMAVARKAKAKGWVCEASLENKMACGLGACLCCVENTAGGNVCVCKEGPVFNVDRLLWK